MSVRHELYKFSASCRTDDLVVLFCLRGISHFVEKDGMPQIAWGGTGEEAWKSHGHEVTFRFCSPDNRERFINEANRL